MGCYLCDGERVNRPGNDVLVEIGGFRVTLCFADYGEIEELPDILLTAIVFLREDS
jgi:hypothetical protein